MAFDEKLAERVRRTLEGQSRVEEKQMFRGLTFMVNDKMCVNIGPERIMCRIDPARHAEALRHEGVRTVVMKGRGYLGWVRVDAKALGTARELKYWVALALDFNDRARSSKKTRAHRAAKRQRSLRTGGTSGSTDISTRPPRPPARHSH